MLISNMQYNSELYRALQTLGVTCTEDKKIQESRKYSKNSYYFETELTYEDIAMVGYRYPHFKLDLKYKDITEIWIDEQYLHPDDIQWIYDDLFLYGVLPAKYSLNSIVKVFYNESILSRYHAKATDTETHAHNFTIDISKEPYCNLLYPDKIVYYISENQLHAPTVTWLSDTKIQYTCQYKNDIDMFVCNNLVGVYEAKKGIGLYIDDPNSTICYHRILSDNDQEYTIDTRFYPCICMDRDCTIRVYNDITSHLPYPETCRLVLYPEFLTIKDPYNTENEYLNSLTTCNEIIRSTDSDKDILTKFNEISKYCYRIWEQFPVYDIEQPDYTICDNHKFNDSYFKKITVYLKDASYSVIYCIAPYESARDILFYNGMIFNDYELHSIIKTSEGIYTEGTNEALYYIIKNPEKYNMDLFTLIKFNTAEDTTIMNIGEYIDTTNTVRLHKKLNRFYRNLLILRMEVMDQDEETKVRISTNEPKTKDDAMWFQLLVNVVPEKFKTQAITTINLYGLDPSNIPADVQEGAYNLELDPKDGPASYTQLLMTYFKLQRNKRKYLALQYGEGVDDPRIATFNSVKVGKETDTDEMNTVLLEDNTTDPTYTETKVEYGTPETPGVKDKVAGDLYFQTEYQEEEGKESRNQEFDQISYGVNTPTEDISKTLWINAEGETVTKKDSLDSVSTTMYSTNNTDKITDASNGDYAIDAVHDDMTQESSNTTLEMDDLLEGVDEEPVTNDDLLSGIANAVNSGTTVSEVENPTTGEFALDNISFMDESTGKTIDPSVISYMSTEDKLTLVKRYITDNDTPTDSKIGDLWVNYLSGVDSTTLNTIVYRILLTDYVYKQVSTTKTGDLFIEGEDLPTESDTVAMGDYYEDIKKNQLIIHNLTSDDSGEVRPDYDMIREQNVKYIMSIDEPDDANIGDSWVNMPAATFQDYIEDVISKTLMESGYPLPEGFKDDKYVTMVFDYNANGTSEDVYGELFTEVVDEKLHTVQYDIPESPEENDIWYEYLDDVVNRICYSDSNSMVIRVNERLVLLKFIHDNIQAYAFDDILLNFRGDLGIKYLSILADLINSNVIKLEDCVIFHNRMLTYPDEIDLGLTRLYTDSSHVITTAQMDTSHLSILYSTNIGRFRMDYAAEDTTNREREAAYKMCIDYTKRDFAFISTRMLLFVNGKYIPITSYDEDIQNTIHLHNFKEIIKTVDILYSKKDETLIKIKKKANQYWQLENTSESIQRPKRDYAVMEPIQIHDKTYQGYYDVLLNEYVFNGRLERLLKYFEEHPDEFTDFRNDMVDHFHAVSDIDITKNKVVDSRIIIPAIGDTYKYEIK